MERTFVKTVERLEMLNISDEFSKDVPQIQLNFPTSSCNLNSAPVIGRRGL
jgi:hypothetical protein